MASGGVAEDYAALAELYPRWQRDEQGRYALVAGGVVRDIYGTLAGAREAVQALGAREGIDGALVVALWPLGGWRHPRLVVESYRRSDAPTPTPSSAVYMPALPTAASMPASPLEGLDSPTLPLDTPDLLARDFLTAEALRRTDPAPDDVERPYLLLKDGTVLARYGRVTSARSRIDAAHPPLAPVVFTSLRLGRAGPFNIMVLHALLDAAPT